MGSKSRVMWVVVFLLVAGVGIAAGAFGWGMVLAARERNARVDVMFAAFGDDAQRILQQRQAMMIAQAQEAAKREQAARTAPAPPPPSDAPPKAK